MMDYVLPFVDCEDPRWKAEYEKTIGKNIDVSRFRPFGTLRYAFRSVAVNMPFIDRIVLIVSAPSQVPEWVNCDKVRIVLHEDFMPERHRPTFSSSAIESDMWRINGLSDRFIYGNDDFFALRPMDEGAFFDGERPRLCFDESDYHVQNIFRRSCRNGMDLAADAAGVPRTDKWVLLKPQHCMKGILTRHMKEVGQICGDRIDSTVTAQRTRQNVTGYIYNYFAMYKGEYAPFGASFEYVRINNDFGPVVRSVAERRTDMICINDAGDLDAEHYSAACQALAECFEHIFPERSVYES